LILNFFFLIFFHQQTHISENKEEVKAVEAVFSNFSSYAGVYDAANLLTNKVIISILVINKNYYKILIQKINFLL